MLKITTMAWKTITIHGWWISFENDSDWYIKHPEVSGFSSIEKIEINGIETNFQEKDFTSVHIGKIISKYPTKIHEIKRHKTKSIFTFKINTSIPCAC